jgi:hypothetical protein
VCQLESLRSDELEESIEALMVNKHITQRFLPDALSKDGPTRMCCGGLLIAIHEFSQQQRAGEKVGGQLCFALQK